MSEKSNYIEHKIRAKVVDQLLNGQSDLSWFADYLSDNFDFVDITSWSEFAYLRNRLFDAFLLILRITKQKAMCKTENIIVNDMFEVSRYYYGITTLAETRDLINSSFGSLLLLSVCITKMINADNNRTDIINNSIFMLRNTWNLYSINSIVENKEIIEDFANNFNVEGFDIIRSTLFDNIDKKLYSSNPSFINLVKTKTNYNSFYYQRIESEGIPTWEEQYLLDMFNVSLKNHLIHPFMTTAASSIPDITSWTIDRLNHMIDYFNNEIVTTIIDTVKFYLYDNDPIIMTVNSHCLWLLEALDSEDIDKVLQSSSLDFISRVIAKKKSRQFVKTDYYSTLMKKLHAITNANEILLLEHRGIPISSNQKDIIKEYYFDNIRSISNLSSISKLDHYCQHLDYCKYMDDGLLDELHEQFLELIIKYPTDQMVSSLFYYYLVFLMKVRTENSNINHLNVEQTLIEIQTIWQEEYYDIAARQLNEMAFSQKIPKEAIDEIANEVYSNPIALASGIIMARDNDLCNALEIISETPLRVLFKRIRLNKYYPELEDDVDYEKHDINGMLRDLITRILKEYEHRFMNNLEVDKYVVGILDRYKENLLFVTSFIDEEKLYENLSEKFDLIPYSSSLKLAHVVQLFPLLETIIGKFAKYFGIFPFKMNSNNFMSHKDPSSILREMIRILYKETGSFEVMPELIFVYNFLYNSSSLNIRNECIHARAYQQARDLHLALKVSLLSIKMLDFRFEKVFGEME